MTYAEVDSNLEIGKQDCKMQLLHFQKRDMAGYILFKCFDVCAHQLYG